MNTFSTIEPIAVSLKDLTQTYERLKAKQHIFPFTFDRVECNETVLKKLSALARHEGMPLFDNLSLPNQLLGLPIVLSYTLPSNIIAFAQNDKDNISHTVALMNLDTGEIQILPK